MTRRTLLSLPALSLAQHRDLQLFLLIGQSNMAGRGVLEDQDRKPHPRIFALNKSLQWQPAVDPLHWDKPEVIGVGLGRSFALTLARLDPAAQIGLIPAAFGGTSLDQWKPGGQLYTDALARYAAASKSGVLRGVLWHQGEADSLDPAKASTYRERFLAFNAKLREDLRAPKVPLVIGQLGEFFKRGSAAVVNEQLATIPLYVPNTAFASSAGLVHKGDNVHFDSASFRELGRRYAHAWLSLDPTWGVAP